MTNKEIIELALYVVLYLGMLYILNSKQSSIRVMYRMREAKIPANKIRKDMKNKLGMELGLTEARRLSRLISGNIESSLEAFYKDPSSNTKSYEYYNENMKRVSDSDEMRITKCLKILVRTNISDDGTVTVDIMNIDSLVDGGMVRYEFEYFTVFKLNKEKN